MGPKRKASGGGSGAGGGGTSVDGRGDEKKKVSRVVRPSPGAGEAGEGEEGVGVAEGGSMPPPPPPQASAAELRARGSDTGGRSVWIADPSGSGGVHDPVASNVVYAELRRVSADAPASATLPDRIILPAPGDYRPVSFGRHRDNKVQLDCPRVPSLLSRQHAEVTLDEHGVHSVTDKNTLNGTYLNGNLIPRGRCPLQHGDVIAFGGPANVLRDNKTLRNSFRYEYRRPHAVEEWKRKVEEDRLAKATQAKQIEERRQAKQTNRPEKNTSANEAPLLVGGVGGSSSGDTRVQSQSPHATLPTQPQSIQSTQPIQPSSQFISTKPEAVEDLTAAKVCGSDFAAAPLGHRTPGTTVVKLSRRDLERVQQLASKLAKSSPNFVCNGVSEYGRLLADTVVPLRDHDEAVLREAIAENSKDAKSFSSLRMALTWNAANSQHSVDVDMTQATQEYVMPPFPSNTAEFTGAVMPFIRAVCQEALEIHVSPTGLVSFGIKLLNVGSVWDSETYDSKEKKEKSAGTSFKRGDLIAQAIALALWPRQQIGWEGKDGDEMDTSDNCVFASSISEIDGHGCDIGGEACQAIADGILAPRQSVDGVWVFNECMRGLSLGKNPRLGDVGALALAAALKPRVCHNRNLMFNKTLTVLDLSSCNIGPEGAVAIADALKMVPTPEGDWIFPSNLRALRLSGNRIESKGARAIANLLGPKENKKTGNWTFNPSLAIIDISDNFSGMNDLVAEAFARALQPRPVKSSMQDKDGEDTKLAAYSVNVALLELHLCGHAFREGLKTIQNALDPKHNGSKGAACASVRVVFEHSGQVDADESKNIVDGEGNGYELVIPIATDCAAERRSLSHWQWRPWNAPLTTSRDDPSVALETAPASGAMVELSGWHKALVEDGSMHSWCIGHALRDTLLRHVAGGDSILAEQPGPVDVGLPQWLDDELRCVVCTDVFVNPHSISGCGHTFCHDCISHWLSTRSKQCPICRHVPQVPTSVALQPCHMSQRLVDRYVLPYFPPKDVEARRERAREVRESAAERAAEARRASSAAGEDGRASGFTATAAAAIAMVAGAEGTASLRVTGAANVSALQQMIQMHTQRALRAAQEGRTRAANNPSNPPTQGRGTVPQTHMHEAMAQSLRSAQEVLRTLQDTRRRREERRSAEISSAGDQGVNFLTTGAAPAAGTSTEDPLGAMEALLTQRRTTETPAETVEQPDWKAVSSSMETATPCRHCRIVIPPRFLRMKRTVAVSGVETTQYFHVNYDCLRTVHHEIRAASDIAALPELSEQERRVVSALRAAIANPIEIRRDRNRNAGS